MRSDHAVVRDSAQHALKGLCAYFEFTYHDRGELGGMSQETRVGC